MKNVKSHKGITLISIIITIIILLLLAGVTLVIFNSTFDNQITMVSNEVTEATLIEKIEMLWMEIETSYWLDKPSLTMTKSEYFQKKLKEQLEMKKDIQEVSVLGDIEKGIQIAFEYKKGKYQFEVLPDGDIRLLNPLKGNVKIGDYIEYPIEYIDIYSKQQYNSSNGWRVIDDGVMEGTSGHVRIISTGIPIQWYYEILEYKNNERAINQLLDFENTIFQDVSIDDVQGSFFKVDGIAAKIFALSLNDFEQVYNTIYPTSQKQNFMNKIEDKYGLFYLTNEKSYFYWLATIKEDDKFGIYYLSQEGIQYDSDKRMGIRPVITLQDKLNCKAENNVWKITD